jgi:hypothetical protein
MPAAEAQRGEAATKVERRLAAGFLRSVAKSRLQAGAPLLSKNPRGAQKFGRIAMTQVIFFLTLCLGVSVAIIHQCARIWLRRGPTCV